MVHCCRKKRFFPILGSGLSTKALWLLTFLFFNPLLTLLYLIFGLTLRPPVTDKAGALGRVGSVLAVVLIAATLILFEMPAIGSRQSGPVVIAKDDTGPTDKARLTFEVNAGKLACRDKLQQRGWQGGSELDGESKYPIEGTTMSKGDEHITIFRQRRRDRNSGRIVFDNSDEPAKPTPMIAHYRSLFTSDQMNNAMDQLLNADVDIETIMIFEKFIRNDQHKKKLLPLIEQNPIQSMRSCLTLAKFYADDNQPEKATAAFMRARALARTDKKHNPESNRFKQIAKKLGDESLAKAAMDISHFIEAGFIDITDRTETVTVEKGINEPAAFCIVKDEGDICTVVLTIQPAAPSSESSPRLPQYALARIVKTQSSSSVSTSSYRPGPVSVYLQDWGSDLVTIESLDNERFRFTIDPKISE